MRARIGILEKDPGSLWSIWFPDLPGCVTAGRTADEALDRAPEALRLWTEDAIACGEALPPARTIEDLREDPDVAEAIAKGHAAVLLSLPPEEEAFGENTLKAIDAAARRRGLSRAEFLRESVREKIAG
jgi:predicted RNase H-like HicB family nuclease